MAEILFESVCAASISENSTVLAVRRMFDSNLTSQLNTETLLEDSDVFQCGRCKKQFLSIEMFVSHKTTCNNNQEQTNRMLHNTLLVRKIQLPAAFQNYSQSLILTDTEILQLSAPEVESDISHPLHVAATALDSSQQLPANVMATGNADSSQQVELSVVNDKFVSRPLILSGQQHNALQSLVLNISNATDTQAVTCDSVQQDKENTVVDNIEEAETEQDEPSTVNIITEFHNSMVKSKKSSPAKGTESQGKKESKLSCAYCWKSFTKNFDLQQHIRCHTGEKPFQCIVCGRAFAQKSNVKKHMQTHKVWPDGLSRTLPPQNCPSGSIETEESLQGLDSVELQNTELTSQCYACPYCDHRCQNYYKLKSHMKQHDTKKVYKCVLSSCARCFRDLDSFLEHVRSHEHEMTYQCHECGRAFPSLYDLGQHQPQCGQGDSSPDPAPSGRTKARRYFQCTLCLNKYSTSSALDHHLATSPHEYTCDLCHKVFPCERYLRRHLQVHSSPNAHVCSVCGKGFRTGAYLRAHSLVHSEERPHRCPTCRAAFNRRDKLRRHLLIHEPTRRHRCPFRACPKEFSRPDKLKAHLLTHGGARRGGGRKRGRRRQPQSSPGRRPFDDDDSIPTAHIEIIAGDEEVEDRALAGETELVADMAGYLQFPVAEMEDEMRDSNPLLANEVTGYS